MKLHEIHILPSDKLLFYPEDYNGQAAEEIGMKLYELHDYSGYLEPAVQRSFNSTDVCLKLNALT
jgi:hypothetical protein